MKKLCVVILALAIGFSSFAEADEPIIGYILFKQDTDEFADTDFASRQLDEWAGWLKLLEAKQIHIIGYAINTPSDVDENVLALDRAVKVISGLQQRLPDLSADVFAPPVIKIVERDPVSDALNRRATLSVETIPLSIELFPAEEPRREDSYDRIGKLNAEDFGEDAVVFGTFNVDSSAYWDAALAAIKAGGNDKNYVMNIFGTVAVPGINSSYPNSSDIPPADPSFGTVTGIKVSIRGDTLVLDDAATGNLIRIAPDQNIILRLTLKGHDHNTFALVYSSGGLTMKEGSVVKDNKNAADRSIYHTYRERDGGGVYTTGTRASFTMEGGSITGNIVGNDFTDLAHISDYVCYGGGIFAGGGTLTISGGSITGNTAHGGGGVYLSSVSGIISGGSITANTASGSGGGVEVDYGGTIVISDGIIAENSANTYGYAIAGGGGACVSFESICIITGGSITGNTSKGNGGGVYVAGSCVMSGGAISGNNTTIGGMHGGGGVYVNMHGVFSLQNGIISDNTSNSGSKFTGFSADGIASYRAISAGGGVHVDGVFTMEGGIISGNTAINEGGGVFVSARNVITGTDSEVTEYNATFTKTGGIIYGNSGVSNTNASDNGAAVYFTNDSWPWYDDDILLSNQRNITAGPEVQLEYLYNSGSHIFIGEWDN